MKNKALYRYLFLLVSICIAISISAQTADIVLANGKIFTSDARKLYVQAIAIKGNKIMATGTSEEILKLAETNNGRELYFSYVCCHCL